jgi:CHAD domain-containing protein
LDGRKAPGEKVGTPERPTDVDREDRKDLAYWMQRVLDERENVLAEFAEDAVHDLRVAIRRCRSLAWGMRLVDPHPGWRQLNRDGRTLFRKLGALRDTQVLASVAQGLAPPGDPVAVALLEMLKRREADQISDARAPLEAFPVAEWSLLRQALQPRVHVLPPDSAFFEYLAVRLLGEATAVQRRAVRSRNPAIWHELRIAIKRFRYVVENFLPNRATIWIKDLKLLQDLLGEAHDLDVLGATLPEAGLDLDPEAVRRWKGLLEGRRRLRIRSYTRKMTGPRSLWRAWRKALPSRAELDRASRMRVVAWLGFADPGIARTESTAAIALEIFDCLVSSGRAAVLLNGHARELLEFAALCGTISAQRGRGGRKKGAQAVLERLHKLLDWPSSEVSMIALLVRHHRGRMSSLEDSPVAALPPPARETFLILLGVLRLAVMLDPVRPDGPVPV